MLESRFDKLTLAEIRKELWKRQCLSDVVVGCTMYAVISETVFSSGDVKTMVGNINTSSDIDVKFEVTTTAS